MSDFVHSPDGSASDPLEMPAHAFALKCDLWLILTHGLFLPLQVREFLHGATIWGGLLRILAGRVTVAGVDSSFVTPEFVRASFERLLQTIQAGLDLGTDSTARGFFPLVTQPLSSVPAMSRFGVQVLTPLGGHDNMILVGDKASSDNLFAQAMRGGYLFFPTPR